MKNLVILTLALFICGQWSFAGDVSKRSYSRYFEWESTDCSKPTAPFIYELDENNQWEAENYLNEVKSYISCLETEAQNDYDDARKKLIQAIEDGRDEAINEAKLELNIFISGL